MPLAGKDGNSLRGFRNCKLLFSVNHSWDHAAGAVIVLSANDDNATLPTHRPVGRQSAASILLASPESPLADVVAALDALRRLPSLWSPRGIHLVAIPGTPTLSTEDARQILTTLWEHGAVYGAIIEGTDEAVRPFSWHPYGVVGECSGPESIHSKIVSPTSEFVPSKIFHLRRLMNLRGCPLRIAAIPWTAYVYFVHPDKTWGKPVLSDYEGLDIRMLSTIAKKMKFSLDFLPNISIDWTAAAEMVMNGTADISIGAQYPEPNVFFKLDSTVQYWIDVVVWWVPSGIQVPRWMNIVLAYTLNVWICTFVTFIFVCWTFNFIMKVIEKEYQGKLTKFSSDSTEKKIKKPWRGERLDPVIVFLVLLCGTCSHIPYDDKLRFVYITWVLCSLILNTAYQCKLISFLTNPGITPGIENLEELSESNMDIGVVTDGGEFFEWFIVDTFETLIPRYQKCPNVTICLERSAKQHDMAVGIDKIFVEMMMQHFMDDDGNFLLRYLSDIVFSFSVNMYIPKFSILLEGFDYIITGLMQSGLVARWWDQIVGAKRLRPSGRILKPLSVKNLQGAVVVLLLGFTLAICVFGIELWWKRRSSSLQSLCRKCNVRIKSVPMSSRPIKTNWMLHRRNMIYPLHRDVNVLSNTKWGSSLVIRKRMGVFDKMTDVRHWR